MRDFDDERTIRQILVALDASPQSMAALDLAAEIAVKFQAKLIGIYVEDINWVRLADIPFSREIGRFSASAHPFNASQIHRLMHAHARQVQRYLSSIARRTNLRWSMHIMRGSISNELITAAQESDLIVLGKSGWSRRRIPGSTVQSMLPDVNLRTLILSRKIQRGSPILVAFDDTPTGQNALKAALMISVLNNPLLVLFLAKSSEAAQEMQAVAEKMLAANEVPVSYRWIPEVDGSKIALLARIENCGVIVLPALRHLFPEEDMVNLLTKSDCAVLLVR